MKKISVIIPTYNRAHLIGRAIRSVLLQGYENMEIIIIDDASKDNTKEVIEEFNEPRIRYCKSSRNRGAAFSRNVGIRMAKGEYIAFQDSDDEWLEGKLQKQMEIIEQGDFGLVYTAFSRDFGDGNLTIIPDRTLAMQKKRGTIYPHVLEQSFIATPTILVKRKVLLEVGGFDENMKNYEDYELALRIAKKCNIGFVDEVLTKSYTDGGNIDFNPKYSIESSVYILKKHEDDLKKYNLYEVKKKKIMSYAKQCGLEEMVSKLYEKLNL